MADRLVAVEVPGRKGQIPIMTGPESLGVIDAGTNGQVLTADSSSTTGVAWTDSGVDKAVADAKAYTNTKVTGLATTAAMQAGDQKALADAKAYTDAALAEVGVLVGPGRPNAPATTGGVINGAEPVGAEYRSTDGAGVGAWTWRKRPTGWVVTDGDTGWRNILPDLLVGEAITARVRRTTHEVSLILTAWTNRDTAADPQATVTLFNYMQGFGTAVSLYRIPIASTAPTIADAYLEPKLRGSWDLASPLVNIRRYITETLPAENTWPTSLPGTAA